MSFVCIECALPVESLHVEYSERNFRLTRCGHCGSVADKYIEFELLLVLIDIVLHRKAAYRHLMFNRYHPIVAERAARWMPFAVISISVVLKLLVLRHTQYRHRNTASILHATTSSSLEACVFTPCTMVWVYYLSGFHPMESLYVKSHTRLCLSVLFPEVFRLIAIVLHIFDAEPDLLALLSLLIFSMQCFSYVVNTSMRWEALAPGLLLAAALRYCILRAFYRPDDLWLLGGFT